MMKAIWLSRTMLLLGLLFCPASAGAAAASGRSAGVAPAMSAPAAPPYDWTILDRTLARSLSSMVKGISFILVDREDVLFQRAYGNLNINSVMPIASSAKMPSCLVILNLAGRGLIDLDRPVGEYLQGDINWPPDKAAITTRMLLNHTSGLAEIPGVSDATGIAARQCVQALANYPLVFPRPGGQFSYTNSGLTVAAYVARRVTGRDWYSLFDEIAARPVGLTRFSYIYGSNPRPANGANSDARDYSLLLQLFLNRGRVNGETVISPSNWQLMRTSQTGGLFGIDGEGSYYWPRYSCGWWITGSAGLKALGSLGPELSDPGSTGFTAWLDLDQEYGAVLLVQNIYGAGTTIMQTVRPVILAQLAAQPQRGDLNGDGVRNSQDLILLAAFLANEAQLPEAALRLADFDENGQATVNDLRWLQQALAGW